MDILHESQHRSTCADDFKKGCGNIKFMDNGCKFVIIILEMRVVTCGTCKHTRLHKSTRVCHLSCSWSVPYLMQELYNKLIFRMCPCMLEKYS